MAKKKEQIPQELQEFKNSLTGLVNLFGLQSSLNGSAQVSQQDSLYYNNRWYLISNNRQLLAQSYVEHGIIQTLVDQPVDDGFRTGFKIFTDELSPEEITDLEVYLEKHNVIDSVQQSIKWARLFGGGAILIATPQDPRTELNIESINKYSQIEFIPVDMWELFTDQQNVTEPNIKLTTNGKKDGFYSFYGEKVHPSRVYSIKGKQAPSFIRPRLRGWGMSEIERLVRSFNQYLKNQDVIFELLDEAKVDVYKMKNFNQALLNSDGTDRVAKRIQMANQLKNYNHALTMDSDDDYQQKQITFTGLSEMLIQIRQGIAADLKMPITKLFGVSSAGFNSGEDDIENYNSMIDSEVRSKSKYIVVDMIRICCQKLFGYIPSDLSIEFNPLRILNAKEEEEVKNAQFNRTLNAYQMGLMEDKEAKQAINEGALLPISIDVEIEASSPLTQNFEENKELV